jgi:hypothetical protein
VGILVLVCCIVLVVLGIRAFMGSVGPAQDAAGEYATALVEQRWDDAHGLLCAQSRDAISAEDLAALYSDPPLAGYRIEGVNVRSSNGQTSGDVALVFETESGLESRTVVALTKDGDAWRPCP